MDARDAVCDPDRAEVEGHLLELLRREPGGRVGAGRVVGDVAEVEPAELLRTVEDALTRSGGKIDAILANSQFCPAACGDM